MKKPIIREPSTWAGIAAIATSLVTVLPQFSPILIAVSGVAGGLAVILREGRNE